ncbi:MAG: hypothetical protein NZ551_03490, partial [Microscillaceae bacterium]|nr:hypothetical protein [Microscillaceae bacterium]MDW8460251.1 hypothetical protein [Cytophagales bacterium]
TYDDCKYVRGLFSFAHILEWNLMYGMRNQTESSNQLGDEIFIANFELSEKIAVKNKNITHRMITSIKQEA